ncbi:MAG: molybdopterin molybdotransferase MoeA [Eubacteriales bacterium]
MAELFKALTVSEAREVLAAHLPEGRRAEKVPLLDSLGRILAAAVKAAEDVPGFDRSTMDGFAVRARDTYGATESLPAYLDLAGEVLMGERPPGETGAGQACRIATGGMLPPGADAVVMVEYTEDLDGRTIGVTRPVAPGENVVKKGEDISAGMVALPGGHRIRPQDLGLLAAVGCTEAEVAAPLKVGIISTGDELVDPSLTPEPGQVRDINSYALHGAVRSGGGLPVLYGIVRDEYEELKDVLEQAISANDLVLISGGSSVGVRDVAARVIDSLGRPGVLFHGIAVKPGKPTVGAVVEGKPVFGLPGHPASAMVVFELLVAPLLRRGDYADAGCEGLPGFPVRALITRNLRSAAGREDFIRVRLCIKEGKIFAEPVLGKSGLISTMVRAGGLARIPAGKEGVEAGEEVEVKLF